MSRANWVIPRARAMFLTANKMKSQLCSQCFPCNRCPTGHLIFVLFEKKPVSISTLASTSFDIRLKPNLAVWAPPPSPSYLREIFGIKCQDGAQSRIRNRNGFVLSISFQQPGWQVRRSSLFGLLVGLHDIGESKDQKHLLPDFA